MQEDRRGQNLTARFVDPCQPAATRRFPQPTPAGSGIYPFIADHE
jgi:hypothetical protein